ncbi:MAG: RNA methyltransferase [Syntrophales bacterium]|nr:RNA methyltransferase [Syntrophales bacterium]
MKDFYLALLHYPVYNRKREVVTTAVANMDVHDIARAARTYGIRRYYIVTPITAQRELIHKILDHWLTGFGAGFNPSRKEAFEIVALAKTLDEALEEMAALSGQLPKIAVTGASFSGDVVSCEAMRLQMESDESPYLFLLGTGSGLADEVVARADYRLAPIRGTTDYNPLSVRSAAAICWTGYYRSNK